MKDPFETNFTKAQAANENLAESSRDVYSAIASLQRELQQGHPSLPANLDEAAEKYSENILANNEDLQDAIEDAFKEGAKWMAEQGLTVDGTFHHSCGYPSVIELKTYLRDYEGADVTVQIRKKQ